MKRFLLPAFLILSLLLAACSATSTPPPTDPQPAPISTDSSTRIDQQGAVIVEVTPLNPGTPADTLEFDIVMNTHSVDLSMDLATLAILTTDTGVTVQATTWDAPLGGHHVSGKLIFPSTKDGKSILEGASKLTITIINLDALSRVFEWELK
jgi:ABC-type transport system substrate-binding protein